MRVFIFLPFVVLCICLSHKGNALKSVNVTMPFKGGGENCTFCTQGELVNSYACSDGRGEWNDGTQIFPDPLPPNTRVRLVVVDLLGRFNCQPLQPSPEVLASLDGEQIFESNKLPTEPVGCGCANCVIHAVFNKSSPNGWFNYFYNDSNSVMVVANSNSICLHAINLMLYYSAIEPNIYSCSPELGFVTGGTLITITGNNFFDFGSSMACRFNSTIVEAKYIDDSKVTCISPPNSSPGSVALLYSADQEQYTDAGIFTFYDEPKIFNSQPNFVYLGKYDNPKIYLNGSGFENVSKIVCKFNDSMVSANFISTTNISCNTPVLNSIGNVTISITYNNQTFSKAHIIFEVKSPQSSHSNSIYDYLGWIIAVAIVAGFLGIIIGIIIWNRRQRNKLYEELLNSDIMSRPFSESFQEVDPSTLKIGVRVGKGSFAEVFKAVWRGTDVAVKKLPAHLLSEEFFKDFEREVDLMRQLRHPNVLQFLGACLIAPDVCIIMEFMNRGSLYRILHASCSLSGALRKKMAMDAARGMNYLHCCDPVVLHRDLKSHNLLVDENWKVKVCDFGLSRIVEQSLSATMTSCGTPCWTAPEILRNQRYTEKADVYSFGIVLWEIVTREDPYKGMPPFQVVFAVGTQHIRPSIPESCPDDWTDLITDCWAEDQNVRPSFKVIIERLKAISETAGEQ
eukprot:TRINITY_DN5188_c0_g1_i1.p1 TRINITY_DN5188_c0_g1~~TRINITY_DN5188_c0_g1_i1.p1  ORF type:complete len:681 (-),score=90.84 TRINITY_DN5188_c0_g1_i1:37-2079(-)